MDPSLEFRSLVCPCRLHVFRRVRVKFGHRATRPSTRGTPGAGPGEFGVKNQIFTKLPFTKSCLYKSSSTPPCFVASSSPKTLATLEPPLLSSPPSFLPFLLWKYPLALGLEPLGVGCPRCSPNLRIGIPFPFSCSVLWCEVTV